MATIGEVMIKLGGDASGFARTLGSVTGDLTSAIGKIVKVGAVLTGAFAGLAGIGLGVFTKQVADLGDDLFATSQKTGFTVEMLSALRLAAQLNNAEFGDLTTGIRLMQRNLANADEEGQAAMETLKNLGFSAGDVTRAMTDGQGFLESFAQKIAGIEEPAKRVQTAMAVMGRQGANLIPLLLDIADRGLGGVQAEADKLGATFSTKLAVASDRFNDNMAKLGAALNGLKVTILGPLVTALATLTEQFLRSDFFASLRAQIDELANSGKLEQWAKNAVFFVIDGFATMTRAIATIFPMAAFVVVGVMKDITSAIAEGLNISTMVIGNMTIAFAEFFKQLSFLPFVGDSFKTISNELLTAGGHITNALAASTKAVDAFSKNLAVPAGVDAFSAKLGQIAVGAEQFASRAKKSFDSVRAEVQATTSSADMLTQPLDDATTESGELVRVSGGVGIMFDKATGAIVAMNRELFGTLNLVRQINAESLNPVQ
jgi:hypothetical protein